MRKTVLITGASAGIGRAAAIGFHAAGWNVVATARSVDKARAALPAADERLLILPLDVGVAAEVVAAVDQARQRFARIDVVVNNAGFGPMGPLETMPIDEIARVLDTNSIGPIRLVQAVAPAMRAAGGGRIINVGSMGGEFTTPFGGAYHASKYAMEALTDALRVELAPFGIEMVLIQPGAVATELATSAAASLAARAAGPYANRLRHFATQTERQLARGTGVLQPEAVARVILRAAEAPRPRTRYKVGMMAAVMPRLRRVLPDRWWDALLRQMMPENPPPPRPHRAVITAARD